MTISTKVNLLKTRRTKIVATLGPSSASAVVIQSMIESGVDVFRLNMSHGDHDFHRQCLQQIRSIADNLGSEVAIMADLCGPKIRVGKFTNGSIRLQTGGHIGLTVRKVLGDADWIHSQYPALCRDAMVGDRILLGDGHLELRVEKITGEDIRCLVKHGGTLKDHAGMHLPGTVISVPAVSEKDERDARFALAMRVDYLALSFVRQAADIEALRDIVRTCGKDVAIIAKIEKPDALQHVNSILGSADGIMVARGDLGIELDPEQVPVVQHQLIRLAREKCKPVIIATQMLESMIENAKPTRAEVSDVAGAVYAGADAVMLSGETAIGKFPVETVQIMSRIAQHIESDIWLEGHSSLVQKDDSAVPISLAVADTVTNLTRTLRAHAVIVHSRSGASVNAMSSARPHAPIIAISNCLMVCRRMNMLWGVIPVLIDEEQEEDTIQFARNLATQRGLAKTGDTVLLVQGFHQLIQMNVPSLTVISI